ncbi:MAG: response regulator [Candidatus Omnitrophica bacterium]|nr:response regulator [Candidatus Omnitrophota bacterium]
MEERILVIDDEVEICEMLKSFLVKKGYEVITTTSAADGIEKLKTEKPKVILLDIRMPDMDGVEVMKKIRKIDQNVVVIMATGVIDEEIARETMKLGASDYIVKPFDLGYLEKSLMSKLAMLE